MCSVLDHLFQHCGTTPNLTYALIGGGVAMLVVFLVRP
jgi:hypothetical protein